MQCLVILSSNPLSSWNNSEQSRPSFLLLAVYWQASDQPLLCLCTPSSILEHVPPPLQASMTLTKS
eukprot:scaffold21008_cov101-Skeletonema_dohrnii-CCMP3373.AAC.4